MKTLHFLPVPCALGGPAVAHGQGSDAGPEHLQHLGFGAVSRSLGLRAEWHHPIEPLAGDRWASLCELLLRLDDRVAELAGPGRLPVIVGGDHSIAAATWRGIGRALQRAPGLLWIDAHLDANTPATTPSDNPHGMPLAALLGHGDPCITGLPGPALDPQRVVVFGARSWERDEHSLLGRLGVRVYAMAEIEQRGLHTCLHEALQRVAGGDFGISIDMDVFEPGEAPGVDCPQPGGIQSRVLLAELRGMARHPHCVGLEITEYNPHRDSACRTGRLARDLLETLLLPESADLRQWEAEHGAHNYAPLPVMLARGEGSWLWDAEGRAYIDMMSAYSAVSFGHSNPRLVAALESQARRLAVTSRAYHTDRLPLLLKRLSEITGYDQVLPMNSGAEAVETALKAARKWGHQIKGIAEDQVEIIGCAGNFHGRTIAIIGLSTEPQYRKGFGPFPPGLKCVPYGDAAALEAAITPNTAAFLVEPIQGEGGILVPPAGYLKACANICKKHDVLLIADEVQTGLGRTGALLACEHEGVRPDGVCLGKALGGGLLPVSAFIADRRLMRVFTPGDHGSTFGGNALAAAVALEALDLLVDENLVERAKRLGEHLMRGLKDLKSPLIRDIRGRGLLTGIEIDPAYASAREICEALAAHGVLTKDTHGTVIRLAPALTIGEDVLELALERIAETLQEFEHRVPRRA